MLFEVDRIWKGGPDSQVVIHTGSGGGDCGFKFQAGNEYLVYASLSDMYGEMQLTSIICDRTSALNLSGEDINLLGALSEEKLPTKQVKLSLGVEAKKQPSSAPEQNPNDSLPNLTWMIGLGIALGLLGLFVWMRRKKP
ncbi:hypothetical protein [Paenibacillus soyae]|uniref:Uncharacterized protein n=1 Tax=Paenibacillus soyae TaxID=2969249 RepID=A0A9X2MQZ5_9BACL|nr:hypothetical protein [Paenibacillus soyae]MCR2804243.1 hypothetical protein [Paenibacillus soyae]